MKIAVSVDANPSRDSNLRPFLRNKLAQIKLIFSYFNLILHITIFIKWGEIDLHVSADISMWLD